MTGAADTAGSRAGFSARYYFQTLTRLLGAPGRFFAELPADPETGPPLGYLTASALIYAAAALMHGGYPKPVLVGGIFFVNAMGMTAMAAVLGYMVMVTAAGKRAGFKAVFSIYAFAAGTTLLIAWAPLFTVVAEIWKWGLIGVGLTRHAGLSRRTALLIVAVSIGGLFLFFWSALPLLPHGSGRTGA